MRLTYREEKGGATDEPAGCQKDAWSGSKLSSMGQMLSEGYKTGEQNNVQHSKYQFKFPSADN